MRTDVFGVIELVKSYSLNPFVDRAHSWNLPQWRGYWGYAKKIPELDKYLKKSEAQVINRGGKMKMCHLGRGGAIVAVQISDPDFEYSQYILFCPNSWYPHDPNCGFDFVTREIVPDEDGCIIPFRSLIY